MCHKSVIAVHKILLAISMIGILAPVSPSFSQPVQAAGGLPDSPEFGYGARMDIWGQEIELAVNVAAGVGVEWIGADFDWARHWPDAAVPASLEQVDRVMELVQRNRLSVLLSITNPPTWVMTPSGPDSNQVAGLVVMLAKRYPASLLTIELFPEANTSKGWGAPPDPNAYAALYAVSQNALQAAGSPVLLVAAGLAPRTGQSPNGDMDDIGFLTALYQTAAGENMPIIGLRLNQSEGDAMAQPGQGAPNALRHYEDIRSVMRNFNHENSLIWITGFRWPNGSNDPILWLNQAYPLMRSQLYIGAAFLDRLNPPADGFIEGGIPSLISVDSQGTSLHPAVAALGQIITSNHPGQIFLNKKRIRNRETGLRKQRQA
jgi:hypothetical protein